MTLQARQGERDTIVFELVDNGPGISPGLHESLGTAPVDSTQGSYGVGLYIWPSARPRGWAVRSKRWPRPRSRTYRRG